MGSLRCSLGFHKWSEESKNKILHTREANYDSAFAYFEYGSSNFYQYECERKGCGKKQWYAERINTGIGVAHSPIYRKKLNIKNNEH